MPKDYSFDPMMPPRRVTRLAKVKRVRPYDYRRDGAVGKPNVFPWAGGIFGQPHMPANHPGIFEDRWALPNYVETAEMRGGPLQYTTLRADPTMSDPIERDITMPDLGIDPPTGGVPTVVKAAGLVALGVALGWAVFGK